MVTNAVGPNDSNVLLRAARVVHVLFLATAPAAFVILTLLHGYGSVAALSHDDPTLGFVELMFVGLSFLCIAIGFLLPRLALRDKAATKTDIDVSNTHLLRTTFFCPPIVFGFVLGILGGVWFLVTLLILFGEAALLLSFPTRRRWAAWLGNRRL